MALPHEQQPPGALAWATRPPVFATLLTLLVALILAPAARHAFVMDDAAYITSNPAVTAGVPLPRYFTERTTLSDDPDLQWQSYRPLRTLAFRAVVLVAGVNPAAFRLVNLALYGVAIWLVMKLLAFAAMPRNAILGATALFALAAVHVEPIVYPSALGDLLSLVLQLAAIDMVLRDWRNPRRSTAGTIGAVLLSLGALLAKEAAAVTPALLLLIAATLPQFRAVARRRVGVDVVVHGVVLLGFLAARTAVTRAAGHAPLSIVNFGEALAGVPSLLANYFLICVAPLGHHPAYVVPIPAALGTALSWLALGALGALVYRRGNPAVRLGAAWFGVALLPVARLLPIAADMADRYALVASVGLTMMVATGLETLSARFRRPALLALILIAIVQAAGARIEQAAWIDDAHLFTKAVSLEPRSAMANRNLGLIRLQQGRPEEALALLDRAARHAAPNRDLPYHRAAALESLGQFAAARSAAERFVRDNPRSERGHALLGNLRLRNGDPAGAQASLTEAQRLRPDHPSVKMLEIELFSARGDVARERAAAIALVSQHPGEPRFLYLEARARLHAGDPQAAAAARTCLRHAPGHPLCSCVLARALFAAGDRGGEAQAALARALDGLPPGADRDACAALHGAPPPRAP